MSIRPVPRTTEFEPGQLVLAYLKAAVDEDDNELNILRAAIAEHDQDPGVDIFTTLTAYAVRFGVGAFGSRDQLRGYLTAMQASYVQLAAKEGA